MDISKLTSDLVNMDQASRDAMLTHLASALQKAGLLNQPTDSGFGGAHEIMAYLTRQPVPLRGLRLLGVHDTECVQIMHPTKKILINIPKAEHSEELHGPIVKKKGPAVVAAPQADEDEDDEDEVEDDDSDDDDGDDDEGADKDTKALKTRKRSKK